MLTKMFIYFTFLACWNHEFKVHGIPHFKKICKKCGDGTNLENHKCSRDRKYSCNDCDKTYATQLMLTRHIKTIHTKEKKSLCKMCDKSYADDLALKDHVNQSHSKVLCPHCNKLILHRGELKRHLALEHGITDGALFCNICPKTVFFVPFHYKKHMSEKHGFKLEENNQA